MWDEEQATWITPSNPIGDCLGSVVEFAVRAIKPSLANGYEPVSMEWDDPDLDYSDWGTDDSDYEFGSSNLAD